MTHLPDWIEALSISGIYLFVLVGCEVWYVFKKPAVENTRKFAHLSAGLVCVCFSYVFESHWYVLGMVTAFVLFMVETKKAGLLHSIHSIQRSSEGSVYFPVAVYVTYLLSAAYDIPHVYVISILVLAISDTLAALVGGAYGQKFYSVKMKGRKSLEGSIAFFLATFIITHLGLLLLSDVGRVESVLCAVLVAMLVTLFESISYGGSDNLFIPLGTWSILAMSTSASASEIVLCIVAAGIVLTLVYFGIFEQKKREDKRLSSASGVS